MITGKKKTILVYFLQKTSGTYSESSLAYLHDLLRREGIVTGLESAESTAGELASFVRDGSYLKVSTKKIPDHIRAQIDHHLQKSRRTSKKSSAASSSSAFDELLASIDSDDPKFSMDTTLGLDFSSLEELESDLKKHALDSLSPALFTRNNNNNTYAQPHNYARNSRLGAASDAMSDDFADVGEVYEQEQKVVRAHSGFDGASDLVSVSPETSESFKNSVYQNGVLPANSIPDFPNERAGNISHMIGSASVNSPNFQQTFVNQVPLSFIADAQNLTTKNEQQQFFAQLQLRASLLDAKERLLSSKISSTHDPAVLRAVSMLDEKLLQFSQQQQLVQQQSNFALPQSGAGLSDTASTNGVSASVNSGHVKSISSQIKSYVQEIMGAQKSMHELQQVFAHTMAHTQVPPTNTVQQITPAQVREMAKQEKQEVAKLRTQLTSLQEQFTALSAQIISSQQNLQVRSANHHNVRARVKPLRATAMHRHDLRDLQSHTNSQLASSSRELVAPQRQLVELDSFQENMSFTGLTSEFEETAQSAPTLQKMYALLAVGMRELPISSQRARHIYEQLQSLYATLSFDEKPVIYPSIVEFYASLTNKMRGAV